MLNHATQVSAIYVEKILLDEAHTFFAVVSLGPNPRPHSYHSTILLFFLYVKTVYLYRVPAYAIAVGREE